MTQLIERATEADIEGWNEELAEAGPQGILAWAIRRFGPQVTLACSFGGISGMALLDMAVKIDPAIKVFYLDTGFLFPETYALRDEAMRKYNISPVGFGPQLSTAQQAAQFGEGLWQRDPDKCCAIRKIEPNRQALVGMQAWIAGLRRDQSTTRRQVRPVVWDAKFELLKISPLWDWTEDMVWTYIRAEEVPYNSLHAQGYPSIGCTNCTRPVAAGEDSRAGRWSGTSKTECGLHK